MQSDRPTPKVNATSGTCWFVPVNLGNERIEMLVDTGSGVSIISKQTYEELGNRKPRLKKNVKN